MMSRKQRISRQNGECGKALERPAKSGFKVFKSCFSKSLRGLRLWTQLGVHRAAPWPPCDQPMSYCTLVYERQSYSVTGLACAPLM